MTVNLVSRASRKAETRAKLLQSARRLFDAVGFEAATVRDIAEAAGLSTGALFASFPGKIEIYTEVYGHRPFSPEIARALAAALQSHGVASVQFEGRTIDLTPVAGWQVTP